MGTKVKKTFRVSFIDKSSPPNFNPEKLWFQPIQKDFSWEKKWPEFTNIAGNLEIFFWNLLKIICYCQNGKGSMVACMCQHRSSLSFSLSLSIGNMCVVLSQSVEMGLKVVRYDKWVESK